MAVIRIKSAGFGQSQAWAITFVPTPPPTHPLRLSCAELQPKSAALAHEGSFHDTQALQGTSQTHSVQRKNPYFNRFKMEIRTT